MDPPDGCQPSAVVLLGDKGSGVSWCARRAPDGDFLLWVGCFGGRLSCVLAGVSRTKTQTKMTSRPGTNVPAKRVSKTKTSTQPNQLDAAAGSNVNL
jgi:hypothetical protein